MTQSAAFSRILVPVGFEPASDDAIEAGHAVRIGPHDIEFAPAMRKSVTVAAAIARQNDATLELLHATPPVAVGAIYTGPVSVPSQILEQINEKSKAVSLEALALLRDQYCKGLEVELVATPGSPLTIINDEAKRFAADLIVMTTSGRSRVERFFIGSTADRIIRQAPCPVLIIPASS